MDACETYARQRTKKEDVELDTLTELSRNTRAFLIYGTVLNMVPNYRLKILTLAV